MTIKTIDAPPCASCRRLGYPCKPDCFERDYGSQGYPREAWGDFVAAVRGPTDATTEGSDR